MIKQPPITPDEFDALMEEVKAGGKTLPVPTISEETVNILQETLDGPVPRPTPGAFGGKFRRPLLPPFRTYPSISPSIVSQDTVRIEAAKQKRIRRSQRNGRLSQ